MSSFDSTSGEPTSAEQQTAWRIIDANFNRVSEGLRVVEEHCRFHLNDQHLTTRLKRLRHEITAIITELGADSRLAARDTIHDVGTGVTTPTEFVRSTTNDLVQANWQRVQQSLRVLEEYLKLLSPPRAEQLEALRYQSYTLAKAIHFTADGKERLAKACLYVLIPATDSAETFTKLVQQLLIAKVDLIQLRDKHATDRTLLSRAHLLRQFTRGTETLFIMNDRPDLAVLADADGVHVGQEELSVIEVRKIVGPRPLIGVSTHSLDQARAAVLAGANYIGCGPTFPSGTKAFQQFPGLEFLREVAAEISLPAFAIGGITRENVEGVVAAGMRRIAVSGGIVNEASIPQTAEQFRQQLMSHG